jgi:hypothetical protein
VELKIIREIPPTLKPRAIERAVWDFVHDVESIKDKIGFYDQAIKRIAESLIFGRKDSDIWIAEENGDIKAFVIAHLIYDIDDKIGYWIYEPYIVKELRDTGFMKDQWIKIKDRARSLLCKRMIIMTAHDKDKIGRFLNEEFVEHAKILKMNLEE